MSILKKIFHRKNSVKANEVEATEATEATETAEVVETDQAIETVEPSNILEATANMAPNKPNVPASEIYEVPRTPEIKAQETALPELEASVPNEPVNLAFGAETVEVESVEPTESGKTPIEHHCHDPNCHDPHHSKVETIPLGKDEIKALQNSRYETIKGRFTKTFVIEKGFWAFVDSKDPTKPGRTPVKVKRIAELRAASMMNALNMIGWDTRNTKVIDVRDEFNGEVEISIDGKSVSRVSLPEGFDKFETAGCGARKVLIAFLKDRALADESVKKLLSEKMLVVSGWAYQPCKRINLVTSFDKAAREAAKAKRKDKSPIQLVMADKPVETAVEAPAVDAPAVEVSAVETPAVDACHDCKSTCPEDAPSKSVVFDSPEACKEAMLHAIIDGCERSAKQIDAIIK